MKSVRMCLNMSGSAVCVARTYLSRVILTLATASKREIYCHECLRQSIHCYCIENHTCHDQTKSSARVLCITEIHVKRKNCKHVTV